MSETIGFECGKVKLKIAVGVAGGAAVLEIIESNSCMTSDIVENGAYLDDIFYSGTVLPKEPGVYIFEGATRRAFPGSDSWQHKGAFKKVAPADDQYKEKAERYEKLFNFLATQDWVEPEANFRLELQPTISEKEYLEIITAAIEGELAL